MFHIAYQIPVETQCVLAKRRRPGHDRSMDSCKPTSLRCKNSPLPPSRPKAQRASLLWLDMLLLALLLGGTLWLAARAGAAQGVLPQSWQWQRMADYILWHDAAGWHAGLLLKGLAATLRLGCWSGALALVWGTLLGVWTARGRGPAVFFGHGMVTLLRNTPPLVLLFLLYFFASESLFLGLDRWLRTAPPLLREAISLCFAPSGQVDRMAAAVLTLGLYEGAYVAEIVRAGLQSVPAGQWDAGAALGFSHVQRLRLVIFPQSLPLMLPPLAGQCVSTFKDSALASLISVPELTFQGMEVMSVTRLPFETWAVTGLLYLLVSLACTSVFRQLEKRMRWHRQT